MEEMKYNFKKVLEAYTGKITQEKNEELKKKDQLIKEMEDELKKKEDDLKKKEDMLKKKDQEIENLKKALNKNNNN